MHGRYVRWQQSVKSKRIALNLKVVNGANGVNGQDQVLRLGARWTF